MPIPTTVLTITSALSVDGKWLTITDTTPNGVGTTGYGQTSGLAVAGVTSATIGFTLYKTDTTTVTYTPVTVFPTATYIAPFAAGSVYVLQMDSFGGSAGDVFPTGVTNLTYTVNGTVSAVPVTYSVNAWRLWSASECCCIDKAKADLNCPNCGASPQFDLWNADVDLKGAIYAAGCGKTQKALVLLTSVQNYCNGNCKECD